MLALVMVLAQNCVNYGDDAGCRVDELRVEPIGYTARGATDHVGLVSYADAYGNRYGILGLGGLSGVTAIYGGLNLENDHHRYVQVNYYGVLWPDNDDDWQLGYVNIAWANSHTYRLTTKPRTITCADNGNGEPCTSTATPHSSSIRFDCLDASGCEYVPGTATIQLQSGAGSYVTVDDGRQLCITNVSESPLTVRDTGSMVLEGDFVGWQFASLCLERVGSSWVERSRRNP
jgi:hypothetical protein